ncbi:MAG: hypothetical protein LBP68_07480, partial [Acidobacteriota bacterium]|nr:hypothetical protein [Acidobacteriota bacterium]
MITVNGFTFPQTLNDEVAAAVERIPVDGLLLLAKTEGLTKGFRLEPANAKVFRQRLLTHIVHPSKPMPDIVLEALRKNSFQQDFVCVLSTGALLVGYTKIARFVGEARLLFGMLLDERDEIFG